MKMGNLDLKKDDAYSIKTFAIENLIDLRVK